MRKQKNCSLVIELYVLLLIQQVSVSRIWQINFMKQVYRVQDVFTFCSISQIFVYNNYMLFAISFYFCCKIRFNIRPLLPYKIILLSLCIKVVICVWILVFCDKSSLLSTVFCFGLSASCFLRIHYAQGSIISIIGAVPCQQ